VAVKKAAVDDAQQSPPVGRRRSPESGRQKGWKAREPRATPAVILEHRLDGFVTAAEIARVLAMERSTVINRCSKGALPARDLGTKGAAYRWLVDLPACLKDLCATFTADGPSMGRITDLVHEVEAYLVKHGASPAATQTLKRLRAAADGVSLKTRRARA
jgi:hypothetical protein